MRIGFYQKSDLDWLEVNACHNRAALSWMLDMILNRKILLLLLLFFQLFYMTAARSQQDTGDDRITTIRIGVLAFRGTEMAYKRWGSIAKHLSRKLPEYRFTIHPYDLEGMSRAVENEDIDFVLTNPGNYVNLETTYGVTRIATLSNDYKGQQYTVYGASIFVRADKSDINKLSDLKGKSFMAVSENAFGGFQMAWRELHEAGMNPHSDFSRLEFSGFPQDKIVRSVLNGEVDAGTVRSETLARMADENKIDLEDIRILNPKFDKRYPFPHSTRVYPGWAFAKLLHTPDILAQRVLVALLVTYPEPSDFAADYTHKWTIPLDYSQVHETFRILKIAPYSQSDKVTLIKVLRQYRYWIAAGVVFLLTLMISTLYVNRINQRLSASRKALEIEVTERKQAQRALAEHSELLEETVQQRTVELQAVNLELEQDIQTRKQIEEMLRINEMVLRRLYEITSNPGLSFDNKVMALLELATEHFQVEQGMVLQMQDDDYIVLYKWSNMEMDYSFSTESKVPFCYGMKIMSAEQNPSAICFIEKYPRPQMFSNLDMDMMQLIGQWIGGEMGRIHAEEKARQHQHELAHVSRLGTMGEMASGIAHELNQPLTAISNYTRGSINRLRDNNPDIENIIQAIDHAAREADRAAEIIKRLRSFVKKGESIRDVFNINEALETVVSIMSREIKKQSVDIVLNLDATLPEIIGDHIQLEQVMLNLLRNGIESTLNNDGGRKIELASWLENDHVCISVQDNGSGMDASVREKLFHPFFTTKREGMGLGLSISESIIESHGGQLHLVKSETGKGSLFRFTIPVNQNGK
jgi:signal transduction histidine kinase/ABC-type phosphate/phosphonate transport system substrate-binding protein